jgi:hypothetical protein
MIYIIIEITRTQVYCQTMVGNRYYLTKESASEDIEYMRTEFPNLKFGITHVYLRKGKT